ncbi:MAG: cation-translocating P-type ATPase [Anaerolineae bacterium]|nr:cation-translocating P-type ATPase [Promineifilum sp.]MCZ2115777.1 cation-translocating P-type ATPase [Anaerolineae bacterium]
MSEWYQLETEATLRDLGTTVQTGLTSGEAARRLEEYGPNELVEKGAKSPFAILLDQFKDLMVIILILAALASAVLGETESVIIIIAIVVLNAIIGFSQEYRAEQAIAALKKLAVPTVSVIRDGQLMEVSANTLVPGDIVKLETGDMVPADGRVVESVNLRAQEAALTGESVPISKHTNALTSSNGSAPPLGDRRNMVYMGTAIIYGRGTVVITDTGMKTELGNIAELIQGVQEEQTPLQRRLDHLGKVLGIAAIIIVIIVVAEGLFRGDHFTELFLVGISLAVAAVPEGLPAVVAITLALGAQRMLKRNALIRRLPAVETLGSVTIICSDKTGTLTQDRMTVTMLDVAGREYKLQSLAGSEDAIFDAVLRDGAAPEDRAVDLLLIAGALCSDAFIQRESDGNEHVVGDPTEGAFVIAANIFGHGKKDLESRWPRVSEVPFTSERKRMTTIHASSAEDANDHVPWGQLPYVAFSKGAADVLLETCTRYWTGKEILPLDDDMRQRVLDANARSAQSGQRVLGVAFRGMPELIDTTNESAIESDMIFIGLVSMIDPARPEVKSAVATAKQAGIRSVMITGDHPLTAQYIARDLAITTSDRYLTGPDLVQMSAEDLRQVVYDVPVYARVSPEHKLNIVEALQDLGEVVAMTGDGVNDAPALKRADIGVAMGITGTDVSKEAADMVLLDDNYATIVAAIEEGRNIYDNIRKFVTYILSSNTGELFVMFIGPFLGLPLPLLAVQILWINLVTDGLPGLALAMEPAERGIMSRPPYRPDESILSRGIGRRIIWIGVLIGILALLVGLYYYKQDPNGPWQTMIFTILTLGQMGNALALRAHKQSVFSVGIFSNKLMIVAIVSTIILQLLLIYTELGQRFFEVMPLSSSDLAIGFGVSVLVFLAVEFEKWLIRRGVLAG